MNTQVVLIGTGFSTVNMLDHAVGDIGGYVDSSAE